MGGSASSGACNVSFFRGLSFENCSGVPTSRLVFSGGCASWKTSPNTCAPPPMQGFGDVVQHACFAFRDGKEILYPCHMSFNPHCFPPLFFFFRLTKAPILRSTTLACHHHKLPTVTPTPDHSNHVCSSFSQCPAKTFVVLNPLISAISLWLSCQKLFHLL